MNKERRGISARRQRTRHEGPTVFLLVKRRDLLGGEIKVGAGGVLRLSVSEALGHDPLTFYHHKGLLTPSQFFAGSEYGDLHWRLFGHELAQKGVLAKLVVSDQSAEGHREPKPPIICQTYCGKYCNCPAKDWMESYARFGEADRYLQRYARNKDRIIMRRVTIDKHWPETQGEVARLISALEVLRRFWRMG